MNSARLSSNYYISQPQLGELAGGESASPDGVGSSALGVGGIWFMARMH